MPPEPDPSHASPATTSSSFDHGRFLPGTILDGRYRVVGLIGRGAMGEVYRAEDLRLGQAVALKFLTEKRASDPVALARFHDEVRIARTVSHPGVCRVYDLGDLEGLPYLSMEYVDGEDLESLISRIGRLPEDKAVQLARQICAGLAAAHERGVLHRDLKPANIMVDGAGRARVTDFGLATLAGADAPGGGGTPATMAPELFIGRGASIQSDLYSLGCVLYELFTGRPPFAADDLTQLIEQHREQAPVAPSAHVAGLDPAVERALLACLEKDPTLRPSSALAVSVSLPGGDPLAEALGRGETPSPELVAAAGSTGELAPWRAWALAAVPLACVVVIALLWPRSYRLALQDPPLDGSVLAHMARTTAANLGWTAAPVDHIEGFTDRSMYVRYLERESRDPERWERLRAGSPGTLGYYYRTSPRPLMSTRFDGRVQWEEPPFTVPGMLRLVLDAEGRLEFFEAVPPLLGEAADSSRDADARADPAVVLAACGLDPSALSSVDPLLRPVVPFDDWRAWRGAFPGSPTVPLQVEAAWWRGRVVSVRSLGPWDHDFEEARSQASPSSSESGAEPNGDAVNRALITVQGWISAGFSIAVLLGALVVGRRNWRRGAGDRRGALRLGVFFSACSSASFALGGTNLTRLGAGADHALHAIGWSLFLGLLISALYIALEPYVRRHYPDRLIAWNRLLRGQWRDPLVARDSLVGVSFATAVVLFDNLHYSSARWLGNVPAVPFGNRADIFGSLRTHLAMLAGLLSNGLVAGLSMLMMFALVGMLLRRRGLAAVVFTVLISFTAPLHGTSGYPLADQVLRLVPASLFVLVLTRVGLLAILSGFLAYSLLRTFPVTFVVDRWWADAAWFFWVAYPAWVGWAAWRAGGRGAFGESPRT